MSRHFSSALMFVSVVAIALAANRAEENSSTTGKGLQRAPASMMSSQAQKEQILGEFKRPSKFHYTEKIHGPVETKIELMGARPEQSGDVFVLRGTIVTSENLSDVSYKWSIPAGVQLINGQVSGVIGSVSADHPIEVELTLKKISSQNEQVHLMAGGAEGKSHFAESAQYNTDIQEYLDADRAATKKALEAHSEDDRKLKVFH